MAYATHGSGGAIRSPEKQVLVIIVVIGHVISSILGGIFATDNGAWRQSAILLVLVGMALYLDEIGDMDFVWWLGHVLCAVCTYFSWVAHGLIK